MINDTPLPYRCAEDGHRSSKENPKVLEAEAPKPEPTTEILFLCSYENCGKTFVDVSALRKHAHVHNEKQYICNEPNCGKVSYILTISTGNYHKYHLFFVLLNLRTSALVYL